MGFVGLSRNPHFHSKNSISTEPNLQNSARMFRNLVQKENKTGHMDVDTGDPTEAGVWMYPVLTRLTGRIPIPDEWNRWH